MDDSELLAEVNSTLQAQRRAHPAPSEPRKLDASKLLAKLDAAPQPTPEELAEQSRIAAKCAEREQTVWKHREWQKLANQLGRRYADCTLENFQAETGPQQQVLESVTAYVEKIGANIYHGRNALLYGPPGTGKDHLATAIMRSVIDHGKTVLWADGAEFYGEVRDRIADEKRERDFVRKHTEPVLLALSDPLPPMGDVNSPYQLSMLFRVLDRRYRDMRPTLVTLNVKDRAEAERRLSPNLIDRLAHNALAVHCNWPSYRK